MKTTKLKVALAAALGLAFGSTGASAAVIDLGFALDESGSVGSGNFALTRTGLANALDNIPTSGTNQYRISVVSFDSSAIVQIPPTIVTAGNIASLKNDVLNIAYNGGGTAIHAAVNALTGAFQGAGGLNSTSLFNIATDGGSSDAALEAAVIAASAAGVDGISYEAIGQGANTTLLSNNCYGGTFDPLNPNCTLVNDANNIPNATQQGFVLSVGTFAGFGDAIDKKIGRVVIDTGGQIPLPAGLPLLLTGLGVLGFARKKRKAA